MCSQYKKILFQKCPTQKMFTLGVPSTKKLFGSFSAINNYLAKLFLNPLFLCQNDTI